MAISKGLRYQILRRDNHACRYCGAAAPDVGLHIDHVTPVALGGTDDPTNLVTACADCNGGKAAMPADAAMVADIAADAVRWSKAMRHVANIRERQASDALTARVTIERIFLELWDAWQHDYDVWNPSLPTGWLDSIMRFWDSGIKTATLAEAIRRSMSTKRVPPDDKFKYMCGILWNIVGELQEAARLVLSNEDAASAECEVGPVG